jgi:hypothetical protein
VGFASQTTANKKQLAPFVAHSTDVSNPGGASSILRAKTPLILDRPSNIRDRMAAGAGTGIITLKENKDGSTAKTSSSSMVGRDGHAKNKSSKSRDAVSRDVADHSCIKEVTLFDHTNLSSTLSFLH